MFHGWRFDPDGDQAAADSTRSSTSIGTCRSVNPRTARRLVTASYTSMIAHFLLANAAQPLGRGSAANDGKPRDEMPTVSGHRRDIWPLRTKGINRDHPRFVHLTVTLLARAPERPCS